MTQKCMWKFLVIYVILKGFRYSPQARIVVQFFFSAIKQSSGGDHRTLADKSTFFQFFGRLKQSPKLDSRRPNWIADLLVSRNEILYTHHKLQPSTSLNSEHIMKPWHWQNIKLNKHIGSEKFFSLHEIFWNLATFYH